jgi:hypothetical protein
MAECRRQGSLIVVNDFSAFRRTVRILPLLLACPLLASFSPFPRYGGELEPATATLRFESVLLDMDAPARRKAGRLLFLGGWSIRASDHRFGGLSALHVEGGEALALTDSGDLVRFALPVGSGGKVSILPLKAGPGDRFTKRTRDSESLAVEGDRLWVAFERHNQIWRYKGRDAAPEAHAAPAALAGWSRNGGAEAMVRLPSGWFLLFEEGAPDAEGTLALLLFQGDPVEAGTKVVPLRYRPPAGYRPTDAALLPNGRIAILNRRFSLLGGFTAKLVAARLGDASILEGEELAAFSPPMVTDNYEALAVTQENGRTILWMASDDNFNPLQRTLLLKFALDG